MLDCHPKLSLSQPCFSTLLQPHPGCPAKSAPIFHLKKLVEIPLLQVVSVLSSLPCGLDALQGLPVGVAHQQKSCMHSPQATPGSTYVALAQEAWLCF